MRAAARGMVQAAELAECTFKPVTTKMPAYLARMAASWEKTPRETYKTSDWL